MFLFCSLLYQKPFSLSALSLILPVGFSHMPFIQEILFSFYLAESFYPERDRISFTLFSAFSVFIKWFCSFYILVY